MGISDKAEGPIDEARAEEIFNRWAIWGETQQKIAASLGISHQRVSQIIKDWRAAHPVVREELAEQSIAMLNDLRQRQYRLAEQIKAGAPVAVGKDGLPMQDPDSGNYVRDYSGYMKALAEVRLTDAQIAKRMGLDAPDRLEATHSVRYVIEGVDGDALT